MKRIFYKRLLLLVFLLSPLAIYAWVGTNMSTLHVEGRHFKDGQGNVVNLHSFAQTYSPWFNEHCTKWNNYNVK
jgi:hypothetical protein